MMQNRWSLPKAEPGWALFLDVDGTLIDIAAAPSSVTVPADLPGTLAVLAGLLGDAVALVSGRTLDDLDRLFAPLRLTEAGQHGAEIRWQDGRTEQLGAGDNRLAGLAPPIQAFARTRPGLLVEEKGHTLAVHYRQAPQYQDELGEFLAGLMTGNGAWLSIIKGKRVFELKPRGVSKGVAVERLMHSEPFSGRRPVFIGDDTTDEDGFAAVRNLGGFGIRIGLTGASLADYRLADSQAAREFLTDIVQHLTPASKRKSHAEP